MRIGADRFYVLKVSDGVFAFSGRRIGKMETHGYRVRVKEVFYQPRDTMQSMFMAFSDSIIVYKGKSKEKMKKVLTRCLL